jgi:hypothetical protein
MRNAILSLCFIPVYGVAVSSPFIINAITSKKPYIDPEVINGFKLCVPKDCPKQLEFISVGIYKITLGTKTESSSADNYIVLYAAYNNNEKLYYDDFVLREFGSHITDLDVEKDTNDMVRITHDANTATDFDVNISINKGDASA